MSSTGPVPNNRAAEMCMLLAHMIQGGAPACKGSHASCPAFAQLGQNPLLLDVPSGKKDKHACVPSFCCRDRAMTQLFAVPQDSYHLFWLHSIPPSSSPPSRPPADTLILSHCAAIPLWVDVHLSGPAVGEGGRTHHDPQPGRGRTHSHIPFLWLT